MLEATDAFCQIHFGRWYYMLFEPSNGIIL